MLKKVVIGLFSIMVYVGLNGVMSDDPKVKSWEGTVIQSGEDMSDVIERINDMPHGMVDDTFAEEVAKLNITSDTCVEEGCPVAIPVLER